MASSAESGQGARRTGPALESTYRFVLWLVPTVEEFPRRQKFLLGDRLQATALDVLERLVEATVHARPSAALGGGEPGHREAAVPVPAGEGPRTLGRAPLRARGAFSRRDRPADRRLTEGG